MVFPEPKITKSVLFANGYRYHQVLKSGYSKWFREDDGQKRYMIWIEESKTASWLPGNLSVTAQLNLEDGTTFNVQYVRGLDTTIEQVEQFYEKVWTMMKCQHYC